ncbi:hypothetical protein E4U40_001853, partial [Claviceps sp. LM458 group G5]
PRPTPTCSRTAVPASSVVTARIPHGSPTRRPGSKTSCGVGLSSTYRPPATAAISRLFRRIKLLLQTWPRLG